MTKETLADLKVKANIERGRAIVGKCYKGPSEHGEELYLITSVIRADKRYTFVMAKRITVRKDKFDPEHITYWIDPDYLIAMHNLPAEITRAEYDAVIAKIRAALDGGE